MLFHRSLHREWFTPQRRCLLHAHGSTCVSRRRCAETAPPCLTAGEGAPNVIPDAVSLTGTIRALLPERFVRLRARVQAVVEATAGAHGCAAMVQWEERPYPPTRNNAALAAMVRVLAVLTPRSEPMFPPLPGSLMHAATALGRGGNSLAQLCRQRGILL